MRKLTVKRRKSFVGCLATMKFYVEDAACGDLVIAGTPCRKLGELKNNEEKTFEIGNDGVKVFAIADKASKDYCYDAYAVPAGEEDVYLSGVNRFNPAAGNAFLFDGNDAPDVAQTRKKNTKKGLVILLVAILVGAVVGGAIGLGLVAKLFSPAKGEPKTFSVEGITLTLTDEFRTFEAEGFLRCYESPDLAVLVTKEPFSLLEGSEEYTLRQYGELVVQASDLTATFFDGDGLTGFAYDSVNGETGETFRYKAFVYKTADAFWMVQFVCNESAYVTQKVNFSTWAKSISVS